MHRFGFISLPPKAFAAARTCDKARQIEPGCQMTETVAAVVVAAGRGERAGANIPKQYQLIGGEPMIRATLRAFLAHPRIDLVQPVINPSDRDSYQNAIAGLEDLLPPVAGGATRQASVRAGLEALVSRNP